MPVGDYCSRPVKTAVATETLREVARRMDQEDVGSLVVMDGDLVVGMITDRDIALAVLHDGRDPDAIHVKDVMAKKPAVIHGRRPLTVATALMRRHGARRLPVVDDEGRLVGVISLGDVLRLLGREIGGLSEALVQRGEAPAGLAAGELVARDAGGR
jgi:CBS domain-containing protein